MHIEKLKSRRCIAVNFTALKENVIKERCTCTVTIIRIYRVAIQMIKQLDDKVVSYVHET